MTGQIIDLARQILLDRAPYAGIQGLSRRRGVVIAVQVGGVVDDLDIPSKRRSLVDVRHERPRV